MKNQRKYFIAIIPPEAVCNEIISIQQDLSDRFKTQKSLKVIPHITLKAPFTGLTEEHQEILHWFDQLILPDEPFSVELNNFGAFPNSKQPVIYIRPNENQMLYELQKNLLNQFQAAFPEKVFSNLKTVFSPHITVAYRDLKPDIFIEAWNEFSVRSYAAAFVADHIHLLQHDDTRWNVIRSLPLQANIKALNSKG